ncbi:MAG: site-specific integrase [Lachnospiraceae bacterium]|nr:site-specific integrase [Lachnospiraceae bacterium]
MMYKNFWDYKDLIPQRFSVYKHILVLKTGEKIQRNFIVLKYKKDTIEFLRFTDFHQYVLSRKKTIRKLSEDGNNRFDFVCIFLNYIYFIKKIPSLNDITVQDTIEFFNDYGIGNLPGDRKGRSKQTVEKCVASILDFITNYREDNKKSFPLSPEDFYKKVPRRTKRGNTVYVKVPVYEVRYLEEKRDIMRDIPNKAFELLFSHIIVSHPELLMLVALSAFAGLRPSEACNVRRTDSPLGPGILFHERNGEVYKIQIDLKKEYNLRSDLVSVGNIKKEQKRQVPFMFVKPFMQCYERYMSYMEGRTYEADYGPLSVDQTGKARTYDSYYQRFKKIIKREIIPLFLASGDPETENYGRLLLEYSLAPHVFRHWFTVQLVLSGVDDIAELMSARGDSSPESALTYLRNKGELDTRYRLVNEELFDYLQWSASEIKKNK